MTEYEDEPKCRQKMITFPYPHARVEQLDLIAKERGLNRTTLIVKLLNELLKLRYSGDAGSD
jgi:hypothetical protein